MCLGGFEPGGRVVSLYQCEKQDMLQQKWVAFKDSKYNDILLEYGMSLPGSRDEISRRSEIRTQQLDPTRETLCVDGNPVLEVSMTLDLFRNSVVFKSQRLDK